MNRLVQRTDDGAPAGSGAQTYAYDGSDVLFVSSGAMTPANLTSRFLYAVAGSHQVLAEDTPKTLTATAHTPTRWYLPDDKGSTRAILDDKGKWETNLDYDAFGNVTSSSGLAPLHLYTGQLADSVTGLLNYGARWYDPKSGRFISEDPASEGTNHFAYVHNNPLNYTDPTGMDPFKAGSTGGSSQGPVTGNAGNNSAAPTPIPLATITPWLMTRTPGCAMRSPTRTTRSVPGRWSSTT